MKLIKISVLFSLCLISFIACIRQDLLAKVNKTKNVSIKERKSNKTKKAVRIESEGLIKKKSVISEDEDKSTANTENEREPLTEVQKEEGVKKEADPKEVQEKQELVEEKETEKEVKEKTEQEEHPLEVVQNDSISKIDSNNQSSKDEIEEASDVNHKTDGEKNEKHEKKEEVRQEKPLKEEKNEEKELPLPTYQQEQSIPENVGDLTQKVTEKQQQEKQEEQREKIIKEDHLPEDKSETRDITQTTKTVQEHPEADIKEKEQEKEQVKENQSENVQVTQQPVEEVKQQPEEKLTESTQPPTKENDENKQGLTSTESPLSSEKPLLPLQNDSSKPNNLIKEEANQHPKENVVEIKEEVSINKSSTEEKPIQSITIGITETTSEMPEVIHNNALPEREEDVATLIELPIDYSTNLMYYYPYFYKTHLISISGDINLKRLTSSCKTTNCSHCTDKGVCQRCYSGYILHKDSCVKMCPDGHIADNLRRSCVPKRLVRDTYSLMAYSVGSCKNMCGNAVEDCSCSINCKSSGNCCTDYDTYDCQNIFNNAANVDPAKCAENAGCQFCDSKKTVRLNEKTVPYCNQCREDQWFLDGTCVKECPNTKVQKKSNMTCEEKPICKIENCSACENETTCRVCKNGTFKFGSQCLSECPTGYRADRITWSCLEPPVFAWYWVYPSGGSCVRSCGVTIQEDWNCSCDINCFNWGNCCQDIEDYCPQLLFWRKNETITKPNSESNLKKLPETKSTQPAKHESKPNAFLKK